MSHATTLPHSHTLKLRALVRRLGLTAAARRVGIGREQAARLAGEIPTRAGTVALAIQGLDAIDADKGAS